MRGVREELVRVDAVVDHLHLAGVDRRVNPQDVVAHGLGHRDHCVGALDGSALHPAGQPVAGPELLGLPRAQRLEAVRGHHVGQVVKDVRQVATAKLAYQVWLWTRSAASTSAAIRRSAESARSARPFAILGQSVPGLVGTRHEGVISGLPEAVHAHVEQLCELPGKVLHVHAGAAIYLRRVLPCQKGNTGHPTTFSPFPITTMPLAEMVNRLASISGSTPTCAPGSTDHVFVDDGPPHNCAFSPMRTLSIMTEPSTSAPCCTNTPGEITEPRTVPPEIMVPPETIELKASRHARLLEHELGRRQLGSARVNRPLGVVEVENRLYRNQIHAGFVVARQASRRHASKRGRGRVAPGDLVLIEIVEMGVAALDKARDNVAAHVMAAVGVLSVLAQGVARGHPR